MNKKLNKKLVKIAFISSPLLALYGITPVYLFNNVAFTIVLLAGSVLVINVLIFWFINIRVANYIQKTGNAINGYLISYGCTLIFHSFPACIRFLVTRQGFLEGPFPLTNLDHISQKAFFAYPLISSLAINTIIIIICNSILLVVKKEHAEIEVEYLKVSTLEAQKKALLQQLQPHFLFNTLSVLKSLIKENATEAENYTVKLSEFLRYTVQASNNSIVTVEDELKFTNDYITLQKVRFQESLIYTALIPNEAFSKKIPTYALQTLVENAIKHNSFTEKKPLYILIEYENEKIRVLNNKLLNTTSTTSGTGLENLNNRYKIIANKKIIINETKEEFRVTVPLLT
jgi:hypothetical protein